MTTIPTREQLQFAGAMQRRPNAPSAASLPRAGGAMGVFPNYSALARQIPLTSAERTEQFQSRLTPRWSDSWMRGQESMTRQRAYAMGREAEDLSRLKMQEEAQSLRSQMSFRPQIDALRGGIMGRIAGMTGVSLPAQQQAPSQFSSSYTPSWMQSYQTPQFPRY